MVARSDAAKDPGRLGMRHCHRGTLRCRFFLVCVSCLSVCVCVVKIKAALGVMWCMGDEGCELLEPGSPSGLSRAAHHTI